MIIIIIVIIISIVAAAAAAAVVAVVIIKKFKLIDDSTIKIVNSIILKLFVKKLRHY